MGLVRVCGGGTGLQFLLTAVTFLCAELTADGHGEEEGDGAEAGDEDGGEDVHVVQPVALRSWRPSLR